MNADENLSLIHNIIQKALELGIAGICFHRNLFPSSFFDHDNFATKDDNDNNKIMNFSKKTIFYQPTQKETYQGDDDGMSRYLLEARHLLHWLQNGISVMKEGLLSRVIFGICLSNPDINEQDILLESYVFDITHYHEHFLMGSSNKSNELKLNGMQIQKSIEGIFKNLQGYSETLPTANKIVDNEACSISLSLVSTRSKQRKGDLFPSSRYLTLRLEFNQDIPLSIRSCNRDKIANPEIHATIGKQLNSLTKTKKSLGQVGQRDKMGFTVNMAAYCREDDNEIDKDSDSNHSNEPLVKDHVRSEPHPNKTKAYALPYGRYKTETPNHTPCVVVDSSISNDGKIQYKVVFNCSKLIKERKAKQWISSKKLISKNDFITVQKLCHNRDITVESVALKFQIDTKLAQSIMGKQTYRKGCNDKSISFKGPKEKPSQGKRYYFYMDKVNASNSQNDFSNMDTVNASQIQKSYSKTDKISPHSQKYPSQKKYSNMDKINAIINSDLRPTISFSSDSKSNASSSTSSNEDEDNRKLNAKGKNQFLPASKSTTHKKIQSIINDDMPLTYENNQESREEQSSQEYKIEESSILENENEGEASNYNSSNQRITGDKIAMRIQNLERTDLAHTFSSTVNNFFEGNEKKLEIANDNSITICYSDVSKCKVGSCISRIQSSDQSSNVEGSFSNSDDDDDDDVEDNYNNSNSYSNEEGDDNGLKELVTQQFVEVAKDVEKEEHITALDKDNKQNDLIVQEEMQEPVVHPNKKTRFSYIAFPIVIDF